MSGPGRPSTYTDEIAQEIVERLSKAEPLAAICRDEHMPATSTVYDWLKTEERKAFSVAFARARADGFDVLALECLDIADDGSADYKLSGRDGTDVVIDSEAIGRSRLRVDTRLKLLAKWDPKRYGDKVALVGGDPESGDQPVQAEIVTRFVRPGDPEPA